MAQRDNSKDASDGNPLACNLSALDDTQRNRRALLAQWLQVGTVDIEELPDGYAFHLDRVSLAAQHVDEIIALERLCCPFLRFNLRRNPGPIGPVVEVAGGEDVKAFVASQFGIRNGRGRAG